MVRMPLEMREWIKTKAADNGRSMNSELIQVILEHMRRQRQRQKPEASRWWQTGRSRRQREA